MGFEFRLPDIGEGVVEGEIVKWLIQPGDTVEVDQPMVEIMTDKATVVIPSPHKGHIQETRGAEGDFAQVGQVLVVMAIEDGATGDASGPLVPANREESVVAPAIGQEVPLAAPLPSPRPSGRVLAAPATRKLARELGLDLEQIKGTGPAGRVTAEDVRARAAVPVRPVVAPAAPTSPEAVGDDQIIPVRGVRRRIWEAMSRSAFTAPHFTFVEECDVSKLIEYRQRLNQHIPDEDPKLTFLPFIVKAVCRALDDFPSLNGQVNDEEQAFIQREAKHIGIAVAADKGLTVPVLRHADRCSLRELGAKIRKLSQSVRDGKIAPSDLGGSTFTITSLGREGGLLATPILNYPEVGILGVHRLQKRPVVWENDEVVVRSFINLSLSCDHRLIDGHVAAQFTYRVIELLSEPDRLILEMS